MKSLAAPVAFVIALVLTGGALVSTGGDARADGAPLKVSLTVDAVDFKGTKGRALIAIYDSSDTWLKPPRALKLVTAPIAGGRVTVTFPDLPLGVYAVSVIHDENANNKLDMHWFPVPGPSEGAGVSNDATATFGPPSYKDARFRLGEKGGLVTVHVRY